MNEVFNVDVVERLGEDTIRVQGRAYMDIRVGDVLTATPSSAGDPTRPLAVIDITTYGVQTPELNRMMTGTLLLQGDDGGYVQESGFLYG